eukprot:gene21724-28743_t
MSSKPTKLRILCLHGSRQDGEILSQRLKKLSSKLADIMELHYMDAPHCLPLQKGQMVAMRCWWRHWGLCADEGGTDWDGEGEGEGKGDGKGEGGEMGEGRQRVVDSEVEDLGVEQRRQFREEMLRRREECSWEDVVCGDWAESFKAIQTAWQKGGGFDGILGFSNGAAAAFLSVAHSLGAMNTPLTLPGLQFVIMAGGYRPDPLSSLLSPELVTFTDEGVSCLISPLALPSLHLMGKKDMTTTIEESVGLADNFMASTRVLLEHELSHCVPQKAPHIAAIRDFLGSFVAASQSLPTDEQLEEMEALSAIFGDEYRLISSTDPPRFTVYLREPGTASDVDISDDVDEVTRLKMAAGLIQKHDSGGTTGHPSRKFSLTFTLTKSYPQSSPPQVEVNVP